MEELKKVNCDEWKGKDPGSEYSTLFAIQYSNQVDEALQNCDDLLSEIGCGINEFLASGGVLTPSEDFRSRHLDA